ncbi:MAG: hypothetical protein LBG70_01110 [Bifidobacteriaceae bacterium]|jgi:UDP-N-acetylmuramyl pentapeptide phosphotransferase/UDP-N-acetylglucosamine-1-phosphate transferase|nr:hypothetical protein [Bifidobacteriaceae bacterium]
MQYRTNYRGQSVWLGAGPAMVGGLAVGALAGAPGRRGVAAATAVGLAGAVGYFDDRFGSAEQRGLRGHLRALRQGKITTGFIKIIGVGATAMLTAGWLRPASRQARWQHFDYLVDAALIAGLSNLINLFDLRPGRALKVAGLLAGPLALWPDQRSQTAEGSALAGAVLGGVVAALPDDLAERSMLGDCGAGAVGALLGCAAVCRLGRLPKIGLLAAVCLLTLLSEKVSFSKVIARQRLLRWLDGLGRSA